MKRFRAALVPLLLTVGVVVLIDVLPVVKAGPNAGTFAKALIAVPVGVAIGFGARRRSLLAFVLFGVLATLLFVLDAIGYYQNDAACEIAVLGLFALGAWIMLPSAMPRGVWRRPSVPFLMPQTRWTIPSRAFLWVAAALAGVALALPLASFIVTRSSRIGPFISVQSGDRFLDAAVGAVAVWFVAKRFAGRTAAIAAAVLWVFSGIRLYEGAPSGSITLPTALVPAVAAAALALRANGRLKAMPFGLALGIAFVPIVVAWPLPALSAAIATVLTLWAAGYGQEAAWTGAAFALSASAVIATFASPILGALALQTAIHDPQYALVACTSGCDGALPWEFFYPSAFGGAYQTALTNVLTASQHWGNYQFYSSAPGWAALALAALGATRALRANDARLVRAAIVAIASSMFLALPSHYLGSSLPTLTRALGELVPGFQFGAQAALCATFFVVVLGGIGLSGLFVASPGAAALKVAVAAAAILLDCVSFPPASRAAAIFARATGEVSPSGGSVAFYPFLTAGYGPEFDDLARVADRRGYDLLNARVPTDGAFSDLSAPQTLQALQRSGVRLVIVSLRDYARRREVLARAHILLPADQQASTSAWIAPDPSELASVHVLRTDPDGVFVFAP